mmetsp:Transcript_73462/g.238949  ORF Transcript_73462/g.238949 Transcript_73462/m.238949 type:complete len:207 (+) Transcript_73462:931-1551(+)
MPTGARNDAGACSAESLLAEAPTEAEGANVVPSPRAEAAGGGLAVVRCSCWAQAWSFDAEPRAEPSAGGGAAAAAACACLAAGAPSAAAEAGRAALASLDVGVGAARVCTAGPREASRARRGPCASAWRPLACVEPSSTHCRVDASAGRATAPPGPTAKVPLRCELDGLGAAAPALPAAPSPPLATEGRGPDVSFLRIAMSSPSSQ